MEKNSQTNKIPLEITVELCRTFAEKENDIVGLFLYSSLAISRCKGMSDIVTNLIRLELLSDPEYKDLVLSFLLVAQICCIFGIDLRLALKWLAGALATDWVRNEIMFLPNILAKLRIDPRNAMIIRASLDSPYDYKVIYNNTVYLIEITLTRKNIEHIIKKLSKDEIEEYCRENDVKVVLYRYRCDDLIVKDIKEYCNKLPSQESNKT